MIARRGAAIALASEAPRATPRQVVLTRPPPTTRGAPRSMACAGDAGDIGLATTTSSNASSAPAAPARRRLAAAAASAAASAVLVAALAVAAPPAALAADDAAGAPAAVFARNCAGCHAGGGNVLQAGATLSSADLERNGYGSADSLFTLVYGGKGRMPGYGADCAPKGQCTFGPRLTDGEIRDLAEYVLRRVGEGWAAE